MSSIHFKFRSSANFEPVFFDGHVISLKDLKEAILSKKKMTGSGDFKLQIVNSNTNKEYNDETEMIPKNTSVVVHRVPTHFNKSTSIDLSSGSLTSSQLSQISNITNSDATEEEKIKAIMCQSEIVNQQSSQTYGVTKQPRISICYHCKQTGHVIRNCPLIPRNLSKEPVHVYLKTSLGITEAENNNLKPSSTAIKQSDPLPDFLACPLCSNCFSQPVLVPCCGVSYCDECILNYLVDNSFSCPSCQKNVNIDNLIPNVSLRKSISSFQIGKYPKASTQAGIHQHRFHLSFFSDNLDTNEDDSSPTRIVIKNEEISPIITQTSVASQTEPIVSGHNIPQTCLNNMPTIASSLLNSFPFQSMALATASIFMNPLLGSASLPQSSYPHQNLNDKLAEVSIPYLNTQYAKSVISGERILTKDEFTSLKRHLKREMDLRGYLNVKSRRRDSRSPYRSRQQKRSKGSHGSSHESPRIRDSNHTSRRIQEEKDDSKYRSRYRRSRSPRGYKRKRSSSIDRKDRKSDHKKPSTESKRTNRYIKLPDSLPITDSDRINRDYR